MRFENVFAATVPIYSMKVHTLVLLHDLYPSKEALDEATASGSTGGWPEQFEELDQLLLGLEASVRGRTA